MNKTIQEQSTVLGRSAVNLPPYWNSKKCFSSFMFILESPLSEGFCFYVLQN